MSSNTTSTRRSFLRGGALLAAPLAALSAADAAEDRAGEGLQARLEHLQDEAAIRDLHQSWLRRINAGGDGELPDSSVRRIIVDHAGAADRIEIAAGGRRAVGQFDCAVELEFSLPRDCTLAQMAHAQGTGVLRRSERRLLKVDYVKDGGRWQVEKVALHRLSGAQTATEMRAPQVLCAAQSPAPPADHLW